MAEDFKALIAAQKETTRLLMSAEQQAEMDAVIAEQHHQDKIKSDNRIEGGRKAWQTRQANKEISAGGAAAKEDAQEKSSSDKKNQGLLKKIAGGVSGMFGKMSEKVKGAGKSIMAMVKGTLFAGLMLAILAFFESEYWTKTKAYISDTILPAIETFWNDYLVPIGEIIATAFIETWKNIKELFSGLGEAFDMFEKGDWFGGITKIITSIGSFLGNLLDTALTGLWNTIATVFGMSKTDSVFGSIWGFFTDTYDEVVSWIKITWFNIKTSISEVFTGIKEWFTKMFDFGTMESTVASVINIVTFVPNLVKDALLSITEWLLDLFGFGDAAKKVANAKSWTIGAMVVEVFKKVKDWIVGLFTWASEGVAKGWTNVTTFITGVWDSVVEWFKGLWTWASAGVAKDWTTVTTFITGIWDSVVGWFKGLWTWGKAAGATEEGGWSLKTFIDGAFTKVKDWVVSLFTWATAPVGPNDSWIKKTVNAVVTKVQEWALSLFAWAETPGGSWISIKVKEVIKLVKEWVTGLFTWVSAAGVVDGKPWSLTTMIDAVFIKVKDWAISLFTWGTEPLKPGDSWVKGIVHDAIALVKQWALSLFAWAETPGGSWISTTIKNVIKTVKAWVTGLFSWASEAGKVEGKEWSLTTMISAAVDKVIEWVKGLFTWGKKKGTTEEGEFSLQKLITDLWKDITQALSDIFPSMADLRAMLPSLSDVKDTMLGWIGLGGDKDKDKMAKNAAGGPFTSGNPMLVGELGPELILPSSGGQVVNAQRTSQMQSAGLRRGATGAGGGPAIVNAPVNTISNNQTNSTVTSVELKHPSAILNTVNLAA